MNESLLPEIAVWDLFQPVIELFLAGLAILLVVEFGLMLALTISVGRGKTAGRFSFRQVTKHKHRLAG